MTGETSGARGNQSLGRPIRKEEPMTRQTVPLALLRLSLRTARLGLLLLCVWSIAAA